MTYQHRTIVALVLVTLVGFALRIFHLDNSPFRGDEAFTVQYWVMTPTSQTIADQIVIDPQPLLAYVVYNRWGALVGIGEFVIRMLPALMGTMGIPAVYQFASQVTRNRVVGLLAALMFALHPFLIWHAQDARNYALWSSVSVLGLALAMRVLLRNRVSDWLLYVIVASVAAYLYYLELFVLLTVTLFVILIYRHQRQIIIRWAAVLLIIALLLAPWYWWLYQAIQAGGSYGGTTTGFNIRTLIVDFPVTLMFGTLVNVQLRSGLWIVILGVLLVASVRLYHHDRQSGLILGLLSLLPPILLALVTIELNVLAPRYILGSVPAYLALVAWLIVDLWQRRTVLTRILGALILAGWLLITALTLITHYTHYQKTPDWLSLSAYLADNVEADDLVIQAAADASFGYYYHVAYDIPADERALPAQPWQSEDEIHRELLQAAAEYDAIWLAAQGFTDWSNYGVVEAWLDENLQQVIDTESAGLRAEQYRSWDVSADEITSEGALAQFSDVVEVVDVRIFEAPQPTGELVVWVYWRPLRQTEMPLKGFVHLVGDVNPATGAPLWSQDDHEPQLGRAQTTRWEVGRIYRDVFMLPYADTLPSGSYDLLLGIYNPETRTRLPVGDTGDTLNIGQMHFPEN